MLPVHAGPGDELAPFTPLRLLTAWTFEPVLLAAILIVGGLYLYGAHMLRQRGDHWSKGRTFAFCGLGLGSAVIATQSALGTYDTVLISVHMAQHMILSMLTPLAMALGAPVTLALRTLPARPRQWLLFVLDQAETRELADITGGQAYAAESAGELDGVYEDIGSSVGLETVDREVTARFAGIAMLFALAAAAVTVVLGVRFP